MDLVTRVMVLWQRGCVHMFYLLWLGIVCVLRVGPALLTRDGCCNTVTLIAG
jgi:hypothetical protein